MSGDDPQPISATEGLLRLYIRPDEPISYPKGEEQFVFHLPSEFYVESKDVVEGFAAKPGVRQLAVYEDPNLQCDAVIQNVKELLEDLVHLPNIATGLRREQTFSVFHDAHRKMANDLIGIFMKRKTPDALWTAALYIRDRVNSMLFIYSLSVAIMHRDDTKHLKIPPLSQVFPHLFIRANVIKDCQRNAALSPDKCKIIYIDIPVDNTATDLDVEHRIAYFREDLGISVHHWSWHLVYPFGGSLKIVNKDRRGELFYYMHEQMMARYNCERLANYLRRAVPLNDWQEPILEGYFSKVYSSVHGRDFPGRHRGATLNDVSKDGRKVLLQDMERARDRILEAIHLRVVRDKSGEQISLEEKDGKDGGIDILGNIVEASILSKNRVLYGNLHNNGHIAIGMCHDPDSRYLQGIGVMGMNETATRDPIFYRWHAFINNIFVEHKELLEGYRNDKELAFERIEISDVKIFRDIGEDRPLLTEEFNTFWQKSKVDISMGLDLAPHTPIQVGFTHLNHEQFTYQIEVKNHHIKKKTGTVRIFMAPKKDERGYCFNFHEQRLLMIELDKFTRDLHPGKNVIERKSSDSSVTIPFEQTFPPLPRDHDNPEKPDDSDSEDRKYCGCGWPDHMLIPRGTEVGFPVDLFVMISDWEDDKIVEDNTRTSCTEGTVCKDAASYCGLKDEKYPDARAMGFPFDRPPHKVVKCLKDFVKDNCNMFFKEMEIKLDNSLVRE